MIRDFRKLVANWKGEVDRRGHGRGEAFGRASRCAQGRAQVRSPASKAVDLNVKIDPAIIGGLMVKLGSRMVDSSLRTKLNAIKHAMKEAR